LVRGRERRPQDRADRHAGGDDDEMSADTHGCLLCAVENCEASVPNGHAAVRVALHAILVNYSRKSATRLRSAPAATKMPPAEGRCQHRVPRAARPTTS